MKLNALSINTLAPQFGADGAGAGMREGMRNRRITAESTVDQVIVILAQKGIDISEKTARAILREKQSA